MPWTEVARMNMKVNPRKKLTAGNTRKLEPRATAISQSDLQETEEMMEGKEIIHFAIQLAQGNRTTSNWKRKLDN